MFLYLEAYTRSSGRDYGALHIRGFALKSSRIGNKPE